VDIALLTVAVISAWFWLDSLHKRDIAVAAGKQAAQRYGLQFLDETVAFTRLWAARDEMGRLRLRRTYHFEVSDTGTDRLPCSITLLGNRIAGLEIPPYRSNVVSLH
jgi:hypothetical protein